MTTFTTGLSDLANAAIARVHGGASTPKDGAVLLAVLRLAVTAQQSANTASAGRGAPLEKAAVEAIGAATTLFGGDLAKAADDLGEVVALLKAVAAEPQSQLGEPWRGVPLHLVGRAIH
jgi:hypothetical protein